MFVKAKTATLAVTKVVLKTQTNAMEGEFVPGDLVMTKQRNLKTFFASGKVRRSHSSAIKKVHLVDVGNADQGESCIDFDL